MHPAVIVGGGLVALVAAYEGVSWLQGRSKKAALAQSNTSKNVEKSPAYAAGKAMGYTQGGIDNLKGYKDPSPETNGDAITASKTSDDPAMFLQGYVEGYAAGWAAADAAKKISSDAKTSDEAPPPPPAADAPPVGKPPSYTESPNTNGYNIGYAEGQTAGRNNKLEWAPGSSGANGIKSSDSAAASKKFDYVQMQEWAKAWDKGYQDGWDKGQFEYHSSDTGSGGITKDTTTPSDTTSSDSGSGGGPLSGTDSGASATPDAVGGLPGFSDRAYTAMLRDIKSGAMSAPIAKEIAGALDANGYKQHAEGIRGLLIAIRPSPGASNQPPPWLARRPMGRAA